MILYKMRKGMPSGVPFLDACGTFQRKKAYYVRKCRIFGCGVMFLAWLLKNIVYRLLCNTADVEVADIIYDSRKPVSGCVFVCLKGYVTDGHDYAADVIKRSARAVIIQNDMPGEKADELRDLALEYNVCLISVDNTREALGEMSRAFFNYPEKKLTLIGITGTKGKTTASWLLKSVLDAAGIPAGIIGTIGVITGKHQFESANTTPESYLVQKYLRMMVDDGCKAAVMEVSSQALMCGRVYGVFFDYGILTNISMDHIGPGEHQSFEEYVRWKGQLFHQCHIGIVNGADVNVNKALEGCDCHLETFGICENTSGYFDWEASGIQNVMDPLPGICFHGAGGRTKKHLFRLRMPGTYNICNALPVMAVAWHMGISEQAVSKGFETAQICGRCEVLAKINGGYFILDYAHNGKSLESILETLKGYNPGRLICIFGCGGNRSKVRRRDMARAAAAGADFLIITTDNPRYEAPGEIIHDIEKEILMTTNGCHFQGENKFYTIIEDRKAAIEYALSIIRKGDFVLLAGKGHEKYQEIQGVKYPFDEHTIVRKALEKITGDVVWYL